jgi:hypothetical protein
MLRFEKILIGLILGFTFPLFFGLATFITWFVKTDVPKGKKERYKVELNQKDIDKLNEPLKALYFHSTDILFESG